MFLVRMSFTHKRKITGKNRKIILRAGILSVFILLSLFVVKPMIPGYEFVPGTIVLVASMTVLSGLKVWQVSRTK